MCFSLRCRSKEKIRPSKSCAKTRIRKMQWVVMNPLSLSKTKSRNKPIEAPPPRVDNENDQNSKLQETNTSFSEADADRKIQHDGHEDGGGDSSEETLVRIPGGAVVYLVEVGEEASVELGRGEFSIVRLAQGNTGIALFVKVGADVRWPLTKDEPTLKLDSRHYLFSIRPPLDEDAADYKEKDKDSPDQILNYGVTFTSEQDLDLLDSCLKNHACFTLPATGGASKPLGLAKACSCERENPEAEYWTALAPKVEDYNSVVAKAIASGSGQIIKGLFFCTNAYASQVQKGGEFVRSRLTKVESKPAAATDHEKKKSTPGKVTSSRTKRNIERVKKLSRMTEKLSEDVLAGVVIVTGAVTAPVLGSEAGQKFFRSLPGDVLLASLDSFNKVLDAVEVAGKDALSVASEATVDIVTHRFGEQAGEVTHDTFEVAGHVIGTAWNVTKVRKAINPVANGTLSASAMKVLSMKNASKAITAASK